LGHERQTCCNPIVAGEGRNSTLQRYILQKRFDLITPLLISKEHINYFSEGEEDVATGPVIISFQVKEKGKVQAKDGIKAILRTKLVCDLILKLTSSKYTKYFIIPPAVTTSYDKMLQYTKTKYSIAANVNFKKLKSGMSIVFSSVVYNYHIKLTVISPYTGKLQ
jgi:hypothetical protein